MFHIVSLVGEGINYFFGNQSDKETEKTDEQIDTQCTEDPVPTDSFPDPGLECEDETQTDSAVPQESVSEAEEDSQKLEESGSLLDSERFILEERVRELEEMLREVTQESERKKEVSLAKTEKKQEQVVKAPEMLHMEDASLMSEEAEKLEKIDKMMPVLGQLLSIKQTECSKKIWLYEKEQNIHKRLRLKYKRMERRFKHENQSLTEALNKTKRKHWLLRESSINMEVKNSNVKSDLKVIEDIMEDLDEEILWARIGCVDLESESFLLKRELQCKQNEMEETPLKENETRSVVMVNKSTSTRVKVVLEDIQARTTEFHSHLINFQADLQRDKDDSMDNKNEELVNEMKKEDDESSNNVKELKNECVRPQESHSVLMCDQMTSTNELELVQVSQTEAEENSEDGAQLENEISDLKSQVKTLQESVEGLRSLLAETYTEYEKEEMKQKKKTGALKFVRTRAKKQKKSLIQQKQAVEKSLKKLKRRYFETEQACIGIENDINEISIEIETLLDEIFSLSRELSSTQRNLEDTVVDLRQTTRQLREKEADWSILKQIVITDHEDACLAHELLKVQYSEMKQQHGKLEEDTTQLREAYSTLESQCEELKQHESQMVNRDEDSVQQLEEELTTIRREYEEMKREREREREEYKLMKARCQEMEELLQEWQDLLKIDCTDL